MQQGVKKYRLVADLICNALIHGQPMKLLKSRCYMFGLLSPGKEVNPLTSLVLVPKHAAQF